MLDPILSLRAGTIGARQTRPWRYAAAATYHPDDNPSGMISFALAENKLMKTELEALAKSVDMKALDWTYAGTSGGGPELPGLLADHINDFLKPHKPVEASHVQVVGSCTAVHNILAWAIADARDAFLVSRPFYGRLELDFGNMSGVEIMCADSDAETCFQPSVVDKFEEAIRECERQRVKPKAVFIINPHNPLGRCYPKETLIDIMQFCQKHRLHLISDEIYACSVFDSGEPEATPFTSVLSLDTDQYLDPRYLTVTYGLAKDFCAPGLKVGSIITRSKSIASAVSDCLRFTSPSGASIALARAMLSNKEWCHSFMKKNREELAKAFTHVTSQLNDIGVKVLPGSNAGFFVYVDLSPYLPEHRTPEWELARRFQQAGVFLHPCEEHSLQPGLFRIVYSQDPNTVTEGIKRIKAVISQ